MTDNKREWAYRCLMRPPTPGAVPKEGLDRADYCDGRTQGGHFFWGTVVYTRELSQQETDHYDLLPLPQIIADKGEE